MVFSYVVKRIKIEIIAKFRASRRIRLEDPKRIMSTEMRSKSFRIFEKRVPGEDTDAYKKLNQPFSIVIILDNKSLATVLGGRTVSVQILAVFRIIGSDEGQWASASKIQIAKVTTFQVKFCIIL